MPAGEEPAASGSESNGDAIEGTYLDLLEEADTLFLSCDFVRASEVVDRACGLGARDERAVRLKAKIRQAITELQSSLEKGDALLAAGRFGEAIESFCRAQSLKPQDASIRVRVEEAERRFLESCRASARRLARRRRFAAAARAAASAARCSGAPADRLREARCQVAARARRRARLTWALCTVGVTPLLLFAGLHLRDAIAVHSVVDSVKAGETGEAVRLLLGDGLARALPPDARHQAIDDLRAAALRREVNEDRFDSALKTGETLGNDDRIALSRLASATSELKQRRFDQALRLAAAAAESRSQSIRAAAGRLLATARAGVLEQATALELAGRFDEEGELLRTLLEGAQESVPSGRDEARVRLDLAQAIAECRRLTAEAGKDLARWIAVEDQRRVAARRAAPTSPVLKERGGEGFTAAIVALEAATREGIREAACERALEIRRQVGASPGTREADSAVIAFLQAILAARARLDAESHRDLAASLATILK